MDMLEIEALLLGPSPTPSPQNSPLKSSRKIAASCDSMRWHNLPPDIIDNILNELLTNTHDTDREGYVVNPVVLKARLVSKSLAKKLEFVVYTFCPDFTQFVNNILGVYCRTMESHHTYDKSKLTPFMLSHVYTRVYSSFELRARSDIDRTWHYKEVIRLARLEKVKLNERDFNTLKSVVSNVFKYTYRHTSMKSIKEILAL